MGLLRFSPDPRWGYLARCAPDGFVIPALAGHFTLRFGGEPWALIDEKRGLLLAREAGREARLLPAAAFFPQPAPDCRDHDPWEGLWLRYHKAVNNEARNNPGLQRRFMPERYWKYLPELSDKATL
jgi:probable DNA metabolism protein